ncbi:MAG TPA: DUF2851 family protein [Ignavibacteria bacterium]|nr:DUF2851 family protein [Ignavibacteria bacterium]
MEKLNLNEDFICRIWENPAYYNDIRTTDGRIVEILDYGKRNQDSGPDYKNSKVKIHNVIYSGDIEIHRTFKDWKDHNHKKDGKYNKVILQVVMWPDEPGKMILPVAKKVREIPTVVLSEFLSSSIHSIWKEIINNPSEKFRLPCYPDGMNVLDSIKKPWVEELSIERLRYKTRRFKTAVEMLPHLKSERTKWEQVFIEFVFEALGYSKNKEQFRRLAHKIEIVKLRKMKLSPVQLDAVLFGAAGFLKDERHKDEYITALKADWTRLRSRLGIDPLDKSEWHFFRLRPPNFPTVRIAYASALLYEVVYGELFKEIVLTFENQDKPIQKIVEMLISFAPHPYWESHYNFGKQRKTSREVSIGKERVTDIITNVMLPLLFFYSKKFEKTALEEKVLASYFFTKRLTQNEITRVMERQLSFKVKSVSQEQGIIQLHNFYCIKGKCSQCKIGKEVFEQEMIYEPLRIILY